MSGGDFTISQKLWSVSRAGKVLAYAPDEKTADELILYFNNRDGFWKKALMFAFIAGTVVGQLACIVVLIMLTGRTPW